MPPSTPDVSVRATSLQPAEIPTPLKLLRQADCYQQRGIKYPHRGTFHSYAELLHFSLSEGKHSVTTFIPHPFEVWVGRYRYIPDAYLVRAGERVVVELKPRGEFDEALHVPLASYLHCHGLHFEVISNEAILACEVEALNWLQLIRTLCTANEIDTTALEHTLWRELLVRDACTVADLLDPNDRQHAFAHEVALYRLLHRGQLHAHWQQAHLGPNTVIERCT